MCRWNAYFGQPLVIDELLFKTDHGLIDQSLHARMGVETTNGDGFGLGWYGANGARPGRYRSVTPAWSDVNLRDLAAHIESPLFLAHIRATTGTPVQQTNCHPFRQGQWLFVHNGVHRRLPRTCAGNCCSRSNPRCSTASRGSTDSEVLFYLALTFGLEDDPLGALERAVGFVEATGRKHGIEHPVQMTVGMSNGERLWAIRYSSQHRVAHALRLPAGRHAAQAAPRQPAPPAASPTRTASSSPSRPATSPAHGSRSPSRRR